MGRARFARNKEWGRKHRKELDRLQGLNATDRRLAIEDQLDVVSVPWRQYVTVPVTPQVASDLEALRFIEDLNPYPWCKIPSEDPALRCETVYTSDDV